MVLECELSYLSWKFTLGWHELYFELLSISLYFFTWITGMYLENVWYIMYKSQAIVQIIFYVFAQWLYLHQTFLSSLVLHGQPKYNSQLKNIFVWYSCFSVDWFITNIVGCEAFTLCYQTNALVLIKRFMENGRICGCSLIASELPVFVSNLQITMFRRTLLGPMFSAWFGLIYSKVKLPRQSYSESHSRPLLC